MVVKAAAQDVDIVPGPETLTLKDPLSMKRIDLPCKSRWCQHTSCFDAATFLTLNEQTPTWSCPICNRAITTDEDLFIDGYISLAIQPDYRYFHDILRNINKAVESVIIHPDGTWTNKDIDTDHPDAKLLNNNQPNIKMEERQLSFSVPRTEVVSLDDDDDDDGVPTPASLPPLQLSRATSTSVRPSPGGQPSSRKRGPTQIVDLTLSDDEVDTPPVRSRPVNPPPPKRFRVDIPSNNQRSTSETNGNNLLNSVLNVVSPAPSSARPSHIRSPPSSISPRNDTTTTMFRYNHSPATLDGQFPPFRDYTIPSTTPTLTSASFPSNPPITTTTIQQPRAQLPSPTISRPYPTPQFPPNIPSPDPRSNSESPVLPAFSLSNSRNPSATNNFRINWSLFQDMPNTGRTWDADRDDYENEDLDLEMARLPSSMFDADGREDLDDGY
jgi:MIZ/SP-RING zinc finger